MGDKLSDLKKTVSLTLVARYRLTIWRIALIAFILLGSSSALVFSQAPTITDISPTSGPVGTLVTITGTNLSDPTDLQIAGVTGLEISNDGTTLVGFVMPDATSGTVDVTTAGGSVSSGQSFTLTTPTPNSITQLGIDIDGEAADDQSGYSVSLSANGKIAAVGAIFNDGNGTDAGQVRVYEYTGAAWVQLGADIDGEIALDQSGSSVSLSADGKRIAIGAWRNFNNNSRGHVRIYEYSGTDWIQLSDDIDGEAPLDLSGIAVSLSADGSTVAVGATRNSVNGTRTQAGHVRVYNYTGGMWVQLGADIDGEAAFDESGNAVSLSADGRIVAIGAYRNDGNGDAAGHARVYQYIGTEWVQLGADIDGEAAFDESGKSISLSADGTTVAIGADRSAGNGTTSGHVRVLKYNGSAWTQLGTDIDGEASGDYSGISVSLSADGKLVVIGARLNDGAGDAAGHVRLLQYNGAAWTQLGADIDGEATGDESGWSVSLSADGRTVAIGAIRNDGGNGSESGHVRVFGLQERQVPTITSLTPTSGPVGTSVTITGTDFNPTPANNSVYFGPIKVTPSAASATSLTVTVPVGASSIAPIVVQNTTTGLQASSLTSTTPQFNVTNTPTLELTYSISDIAVGNNPVPIALGDFNGDGVVDFAAANRDDDNVSIRLGDGTGGFTGSTTVGVGTTPVSLVIGDFNGDGNADFATTNNGSDDVSIRLGDGSGGFTGTTSIAVGTDPVFLALDDFDGDGHVDIAVANFSSDNVSIRLGDGSGDFTGTTNITVGAGAQWVATGDFDTDGNVDFLAVNRTDDNVSVRLGDGAGGFSGSTTVAVGDFPIQLSIGDFNNDGDFDFATSNSNDNSISIRLGDGTGAFSGTTNISVDQSPVSVVIADFNGDGNADFASVNNTNSNVSIRLGDGSGGFSGTTTIPVGNSPAFIATGDFNGDGKADFATSNQDDNDVSIFLNTTIFLPTITSFTPTYGAVGTEITITGTNFNPTPANNIVYFGGAQGTVTAASASELTVTIPVGATYAPVSVLVDELVAYSSEAFVPTYDNKGLSLSTNSFEAATNLTAGSVPYAVAMGDLDGDGKLDLVASSESGSIVSVYLNTSTAGAITYATKQDFAMSTGATTVKLADIDLDGQLDIIATDNGDDHVSVLLNTSTGAGDIQFAARVDHGTNLDPWGVDVGDIDGDGKPDIAVGNNGSSNVSIHLSSSTGPGNTTIAGQTDLATGSGQYTATLSDLDGDDLPDLIAVVSNLNQVMVFPNESTSGNVSFGTPITLSTDGGVISAAAGDLDGDGKPDIVSANITGNNVSTFINTSSGVGNFSFNTKVDFPAGDGGTGASYVALGDLSGDGVLDIAVTNDTDNTVSILVNNSSTGSISFEDKLDYAVGNGPFFVAIGDLDGDGLPDLATANRSDQSISLLRNQLGADLIAYYPFNGNVNDESGNGNNGSVIEATAIEDRFGNASAAFSFDGINDGIDIPSQPYLSPGTGTYTINAWVKYETNGTGENRVFVHSSIAGDVVPWIQLNGDTDLNEIRFGMKSGGNPTQTNTFYTGIKDGGWHMVTGRRNSTTELELFIDGVSVQAVDNPLLDNVDTDNLNYIIYVGYNPAEGGLFHKGDIDDIRIYNRALSEPEINDLYTEGGWPLNVSLTSSIPTANAGSVSNNANIVLQFDGNIDQSTIDNGTPGDPTDDNILISGSYTGLISGVFSGDGTSTITFDPTVGFYPGEVITVTVTDAVLSTNGGTCNPRTVQFTTAANPGAGAFPSAEQQINTTLATNVESIYAADINGDGYMDIISASPADEKLAWYQNDGSENFTEIIIPMTGFGAYSVHVNDINGDGHMDIIAGESNGGVSLFTNDGSENFTETAINGSGGTTGVYSIDVDSDGDVDILTATFALNEITWWENDGDENFTEHVLTTSANNARAVYAADMDNDGDVDVISASRDDDEITLFENDGTNNFIETALGTTLIDSPYSLAVADVDGDGYLDMVTSSSGGSLVVLINDQNSNFIRTSITTSASFLYTAYIADVDGDGDMDLLASFIDDLVAWYENDGNESFTERIITNTIANGRDVLAADMDGDGVLDVITADFVDGVVEWYKQESIPSNTHISPTSGPVGTSVTVSGANFDLTPSNNIVYFGGAKATVTAASNTELTVTAPLGATYDYVSVLTNDLITYSNEKFALSLPITQTLDANSFAAPVNIAGVNAPRSLRFADFDGDGKLDMATISQTDDQVALFRNIATAGVLDATSFESANTRSSGVNSVWLDFADIDRDGKLDLISNHASGGGSIGLYRNNTGSGSFIAGSFDARVDFSLNSLSEEVSIGDLDLDGQPDIVTSSNASSLFQLLQNTSTVGVINSGSFATTQDFTGGSDNIAIAVGDLDGDGRSDVVTGNRGDQTIAIMLNETSGSTFSFATPASKAAGVNPWGLELGDIDGDGKLDIVASSQNDNELYLYRNTSTVGNINLENPVTFALPSGAFQLAVGDLSGDGKPEIVVASTGGGISVFQNQAISGTINSSSLAVRIDYPSNNGELLAIGDLDGDGAYDIAVAAAGGTISLLRNTLLDGPIAQYDFTSGSTADVSGYGFNPTVNGSPQQVQDRFLITNQAYSFDGTSDFMNASDFDLEPEALTIVSWFTLADGADAGPYQILDIEGVAALAASNDAVIGVIKVDGSFNATVHSTDITPNDWYMLALTYDGANSRLYLNGVLVETFAAAGNIDYDGLENAIIIGTNFDGSLSFNGELDDLKIYGRALDATEVRELYNDRGWDVTNINEFSLANQVQEADIDTAANTVNIVVNYGVDPSSLTPTFRLSTGATARISSVLQTSAATANDYTNPVTYEITSSNGLTVENWTVSVTVDNGLIVDMPFNGDATDISGKGNNGTLQAPTPTADRFGDISSAYTFDGNDQINVPNNTTLQLADDITLSAWVKLNETTDDQAVIHKGEDGFIDYLLNVFGTGRPNPGVVEFGSQSFSQFVEGVTRVDDGAQHHIVGTYDGVALKVYVDGALDATLPASGNLFVGDGPLNIGAFATVPSTARFANGIIDDVQIHSRALDADEVRNLYNERGWDVTNINEFNLANQVQEADIDTATNTVDIIIPFGADPSNLTPTFRLSTGATARISSVVQTSGATANDYTNPVTYEITSEDGLTVENWTVTVTVDNGIVLDLPFAGNANDISGKGNDGTVNGGAQLTEDRFNVAGNAYLFDGVDDFIDITGATSTEFSASFWFKANTVTTSNNSPDLQSIYYLYNSEVGTTAHSTTRLKASKIDVVQLRQQGPNAFESYSESFNDVVRWHHMVVTGSATQATTIYIDNQLQYTGDMGFTGWMDMVLGYSRFGGGTDYFHGAIDDVKVFSYVIDEVKVDELYRENGWPLLSEETDILSFSVPGQNGDALIDTEAHRVEVEVEFGTDPSALIATFELSDGATAVVNAIDQTSAITTNDFTNPLVYQVLAEDQFTTQSWLVTVTVLPDMIAYYPFNGNANDASGNGNNGTQNGGVTLDADRFGYLDRAYSFDGVDDFIFASSVELKDAFATSIWFKTDADFNSSYALMQDISGYFGFVAVDQSLSRALIRKGADISDYEVLNGTSNIVDNAWHHAVASFNGTSLEVYIDGVKENEVLTTDFKEFSSYDIFIGSGNGGAYWNGSLDDLRIYGRALTQQEITDLFTEGGWPLNPDPTESFLSRVGTGDIEADGISYETLTVQAKDATGRDIPTSGIEVQFTATEGANNNDSDLFIDPNGIVPSSNGSMTVQTDATGLATVRLANTEIEQLSVIAQIDTDNDDLVDAAVTGKPSPILIDYIIGGPSVAATGSVISSNGPSKVADGTSAITVSVQVKDVIGRNINRAGIQVQFVTTGSANLSGDAVSTIVTTNSLGQASVDVTNTVIQAISVRALIDVDNINGFDDPSEQVISGGSGGSIPITFTADPTAALISNSAILQVNKAQGLDIVLEANETGTIYWVINATGVIPNADVIKSGTAATNGSGSFNIITPDVLVEQSISGNNLADSTRYQLYLVHEDDNGNFSTVEMISWTADATPPEITSGSINPNTPTTVTLVFSEELVFDVVSGITLTNDNGDIIPFSSGAVGPTLNFGLSLSQEITDSDTLFVNYDGASGSFSDLATNSLGSFVEKILLNSEGPVDVALDLALVQINQANGVTISHSANTSGKLKWLIQDSDVTPPIVAFDGQNSGGFGIDSINITASITVESIIAGAGLSHNTTYYLFAIADDGAGNQSEILVVSWTADGVAPTINNAEVDTNNPNTIMITLSEAVTASAVNGLVVNDAQGAEIGISDFNQATPTTLEIILERIIVEADVLTLSYTPTGNEIVDGAFNNLAAITDLAVTNNVVTIPPVLTNVEITKIDGVESIDISYQVDKPGRIYWLVAPTGGSFTTAQIKAGTGNNSGFSSFEIASIAELQSETIAPLILANNELFDIHLYAEDEAGVASSVEVRTWEADGKAPSMISAEVTNTTPSQITVTFDEALVYDNLEGFRFEFIGSQLAVISKEALDETTLVFNLNGDLVQSDRVLLSYFPTSGSLSDAVGNIVRIIEDFEVDVNVVDPPANLSNLDIVNINELISIDLQYQSSKTGKMYWVMTDNAGIPTEIELKTGSSDNFGNGVFDITVVDEIAIETLQAEGLEYLTAYYLHIFQEDNEGNLSEVSSLPWITPKGPPTIDPLAVLNIESLQIDLQYSSSNEESLVIHYAIYNAAQPNITTGDILIGQTSDEGDAIQFASFDANLNGEYVELVVFDNELSAIDHYIYAFGINEKDIDSEIASTSWFPIRESGTDPLIRNLITPNGDGENDRLFIENLELYPGPHTVTITDRNGRPQFTINDFRNDNISSSDDFERLDPGAYLCVLILADGTKFMESITILK